MSIDCVFCGVLARDAKPGTSQAGKPWAQLSVGVGREGNGQ
jgi:hypothetical protein